MKYHSVLFFYANRNKIKKSCVEVNEFSSSFFSVPRSLASMGRAAVKSSPISQALPLKNGILCFSYKVLNSQENAWARTKSSQCSTKFDKAST
jgi:hypothetical protein